MKVASQPGHPDFPVVIAGAGPAGLYLGCRLAQQRIPFRILEKNTSPVQHSRSVGIHPPSLELMDLLQLSGQLIDRGVAIRRGHAYSAPGYRLATLSFASCPKPYNYILTLPQHHTENLLRQRLLQLAGPSSLIPGAEVSTLYERGDHVETVFRRSAPHSGEPEEVRLTSRYVVGCDGRYSRVREQAGIVVRGGTYPYRYAMGDFPDQTGFGSDAVVYLSEHGLVECFPLPDGMRRWVVELEPEAQTYTRDELLATVTNRTGYRPNPDTCAMFSNFGVQHLLAGTLYHHHRKVLLAGDAAHVVSPIGGQGMNLGWLGAERLAGRLAGVLQGGPDRLAGYSRRQRRSARKAIQRAELNMALGQRKKRPRLRNRTLQLLLWLPTRHKLARQFTMRGL